VAGEPEAASSEPEPTPDSAIGDAVAAALGGPISDPISDLPPPYLPPIGAAKEVAPSPVPPATTSRPAAVVVKGKRRDDAGDSKTRAKVHVLEPSGARPVGDARSAETSGIKTAALVNMALAGGRTTPSGLRAVDSRLPMEPSGLRSAVAAATAAPADASDLSAAVAAATTPSPAATDDLPPPPSERRDRRTHPLGWSVEDIESQAPTSPPDESSPEAGPDDSVEARAIVEATTVDEQPGAEEKKKDEDSRSIIILLALAAAVLIAYIFVASG
jgi:hypothetical protein